MHQLDFGHSPVHNILHLMQITIPAIIVIDPEIEWFTAVCYSIEIVVAQSHMLTECCNGLQLMFTIHSVLMPA